MLRHDTLTMTNAFKMIIRQNAILLSRKPILNLYQNYKFRKQLHFFSKKREDSKTEEFHVLASVFVRYKLQLQYLSPHHF